MPPKKPEMSKKTEMKKKEKVIEDKTFGLKNKKGAKQQKFIQNVQQQVNQPGKTAKQLEKDKADKLTKKEDKKKETEELNSLFKPVEQKVAKGTDPKSVLCAFFKVGQCTKGDKCKFSHDLSIGRKAEKRSIYDDQRAGDNETMDDWDEDKLKEVVAKKHEESDKNKPKTDIICRYFLEALELSKYGWFWQCPNGENCIYRHAVPAGFVLKKDVKKENPEDLISLEDLIEKERAALGSQNLTKVTLESFLKWKERKRKEKVEKAVAESEKKKANFSSGKMFGISGREMFEFNPDLVLADDAEADEFTYSREDSEDDGSDAENAGPVREIDASTFTEETQEYVELPGGISERKNLQNGLPNEDSDDERLGEAAALPTSDQSRYAVAADDDIDENLFDEDGLDFVEEELETLELND